LIQIIGNGGTRRPLICYVRVGAPRHDGIEGIEVAAESDRQPDVEELLRTRVRWFRSKADECRAVAEGFRNLFARKQLESVAKAYDRLADWWEEQRGQSL
jgi:hypothetical protein